MTMGLEFRRGVSAGDPIAEETVDRLRFGLTDLYSESGENYTMVASNPPFTGAVVFGHVNFDGIHEQLQALRESSDRIEEAIDALANAPQPSIVPLSTLAPAPYEFTKPMFALVEPVISDDSEDDCEYVASFVEANVAATGDTIEEAVRFLKDRMVDKLVLLEKLPKLGHQLQHQLHILRDAIRKCPEEAETK